MTKPHEAHEFAVVGTMLLRPETIPDLADLVSETDFYSPKLRAVFRAMVAVFDRKEPIDIVTVEAQLRQSGDLALAGGLLGLGELTDRNVTGSGVQHHLHHARQVRCYAAVRELGQRAAEVSEDCRDLKLPPREILEAASERLAPQIAIDAEIEPTASVVHRSFRGVVRRKEGFMGVQTGISDLDVMLLGMDPGTLYVVGARPGIGKTAFYTSMARWNAKRGVPSAMLSVEMPTAQVVERLLCADSGVDNQRVRAGVIDHQEMGRMISAADRLVSMPLAIVGDMVGPKMAQIRAKARAWRRMHPLASQAVLGIDYLGLIHGEGDTAEERIAYVCRSCKELAQELRIPIVLLAQLNRAVEARNEHRPRMSDLRGSGAIEQDADGILFLYRGAMSGDDSMAKDEAEIIVEKHRHGPTGRVRCRYIGPRTLFCNARREPGEDDEGP